MLRITTGWVMIALTGAALLAQNAENPREVFQSLYGQQLRQVKATRDATDDIELAQTLVTAAQSVKDQPALVEVLCDQAYQLAVRHDDGLEAAVQAMQTLVRVSPGQASDGYAKLLAAHQRRYSRARGDEKTQAGQDFLDATVQAAQTLAEADDYGPAVALYRKAVYLANTVDPDRKQTIQNELEHLVNRQRVAKEMHQLKAIFEASPDDQATARRIVLTYLTELDNPAGAKAYAGLTGDDELKRLVLLAAQDTGQVRAADALDLAEWYRGLAGQITGETAPAKASQAALLTRAATYYDRFLAQHTAQDLAATKAQLALKEVRNTLDSLGGDKQASSSRGTTSGRRGVIQLFNGENLDGWQVSGGPQTAWTVEDGELVGRGFGFGWLVTDREFTHFALRLQFKLKDRADSGVGVRVRTDQGQMPQIQITDDHAFYTGNAPDPGRTGALHAIKSDAPAKLLPNGQWNTLEIEVRGAAVRVSVNGVITCEADYNDEAELAERAANRLERERRVGAAFLRKHVARIQGLLQGPGRIGLETPRGEVRYRNIELKPLTAPR